MQTVLAARSSFSIGESILSVEKLVENAKAAGAASVALTDTMSVTGMIDFTNKAKKAEIKPIIGCRLRMVDDPYWRKPRGTKEKQPPEYFVTAYVLTEEGLKALFRLLSKANSGDTEYTDPITGEEKTTLGNFYNVPKIGFVQFLDEIDKMPPDSLAIATGDVNSILTHPNASVLLKMIRERLGVNNVYLTLTPINTPYWDTLNKKALALFDEGEGYQPLVTRPVCYSKGDADATEIMNTVVRNVRMADLWRWSPSFRDLHAMDRDGFMAEVKAMIVRLHEQRGMALSDVSFKVVAGIKNTDALADRVNYTWSKAPVSLPKMAEDEFATLVAECKKGWASRLSRITFGHKPTEEDLANVYRPRLVYELGVLQKLGFSGYFLLVQDIVRYAKENGILVGPGRGSVGGSLVAYLMGITDCDPIRFELLFERFINPDRIDLPDADLDFMSARRGEIVDYLVKTYGQERVAGISNFNSLAAASTIRDVGKAFGLSEDDIKCSKYVEKAHGANIKLSKQIDLVPEIKGFAEKFGPIWNECLKIEGAVKSMGRHAAGVVVGGCDLVERSVIERRKDGATVNWDKRIVEDQGLVKVDILGLETLDLIKLTQDYIRRRHSKKIDLLTIPLDDPKVLENFAAAKTTGVFQFESGGMRRLLKELGKDGAITFEDITAATALYRPGPMESGMMDSYWKRKQGLEVVEYDHPDMEPILKPTFGVMVYQEQVMQVSRVIAGYSAPDADKLRKIMGKKLPEEMAKERGKFVDGCVKTIGCDAHWAGELFDKIEGFAGYGFNKSHSVEYTLISYQSMWLKTNFPVEFYAAALSLMKDEKLPALLADAKAFGITVTMPDVNISTDNFEILNDTTLCIPFARIKGLSDNAARSIVEARNDGKGAFKYKTDFIARVNRRLVNKAKVDILDRIGAFCRIEPGQLAANHPDRIRDQRELIPGLVSEAVPIHRQINTDPLAKSELAKIIVEYRAAASGDGVPVKPTLGKEAKFMVIADAPTSGEERAGAMTAGDSFGYVSDALSEAGMSRSDGYWTALIKRPKEGKQVSAAEIELYSPYLHREIQALKPPIIVLLGSATVRYFIPDFKGKASDAAGKIVYSAKYDANFVVGFNPGEIYHDGDKQSALNEVFSKVASLTT